jgi:hypothetical protein
MEPGINPLHGKPAGLSPLLKLLIASCTVPQSRGGRENLPSSLTSHQGSLFLCSLRAKSTFTAHKRPRVLVEPGLWRPRCPKNRQDTTDSNGRNDSRRTENFSGNSLPSMRYEPPKRRLRSLRQAQNHQFPASHSHTVIPTSKLRGKGANGIKLVSSERPSQITLCLLALKVHQHHDLSITRPTPHRPVPSPCKSCLHIPILLASFTIWAILGNEMVPPFCRAPRQAENFPMSIRRHCVACCLLFSALLPLCLEGAEEFRDAPFGGSLLFGCHVERLGPGPPTMCNKPEGELRNMT